LHRSATLFRMVPDRKPVSGPLSQLPGQATASSFRRPARRWTTPPYQHARHRARDARGDADRRGTRKIGVWGTITSWCRARLP